MSQIIYPITHLPPVIDIGKQTEKGVTRIGFDVHEWLDDWPGMTFSVQPTRPGETESYFAASEMVGSVVFWLVGAVDTEKPGSGTVEVLGVTEDERKLSFMCRTSIVNTNTVTTAEIPEPGRPWLDQVIMAGETAKFDAKNAAQSAREAVQAASDAGQYSTNADAKAGAAAASAAAAKSSETAAKESEAAAVEAANKLFVVKVAYDSTAKGYVADKTADEIRAAAEAGKACLLTDADFGTVHVYAGDTADGPKFVHFQDAPNDSFGPGIWMYEYIVTADGTVHGGIHTPARTPNPRYIVFTGAVEAEYDGSAQVTVDIPIGGGAGLPETADPLKQLVTDENGNVAWEDRLAYKTTEKVVNLEATALTFNSNEEAYVLSTPWTANLVAGAMCTVTYNGTDYECKAVDFRAVQPEAPFEGCLLGNIDALGMTGVDGSNTATPFALMVVSNAHAAEMGEYGVVYPLDGATSVTIAVSSAVESYKTIDPEYLPKSDSDTVTVVYNYGSDGSVSHTFDEVWALANAGKHLILRVDTSDDKMFAAMTLCRVNGEESTVEFALVDTTSIMRFVYNKASGMNVHIKMLE